MEVTIDDVVSTDPLPCSDADPDITDCTQESSSDIWKNSTSESPLDTWDFDAVWLSNAAAFPTFGTSDPAPSGNFDADPIPTEVEEAAPNGGDANNDGIADAAQPNVASFVNPVTGKYVTLVAPNTCIITAVSVASEASKNIQDATFNYDNGLMSYVLNCGTPGIAVAVQEIFFETGKSASSFIARYFTTWNNKYQTIDGASVTDVTIGGKSAVKLAFTIVDGGPLDNDQLANGIIVDPSGIGTVTSAGGILAATGAYVFGSLFTALLLIGIGLALVKYRKAKARLQH